MKRTVNFMTVLFFLLITVLSVSSCCEHEAATDEAVEATCTEEGLTEGKHCTLCDKVLVEQEVVPALGHTPKEYPEIKATCAVKGKTAQTVCTVCNKILEGGEEIPLLTEHTPKSFSEIKATCESAGKTAYTACTVCNKTLEGGETIPALGHTTTIAKCTNIRKLQQYGDEQLFVRCQVSYR